MSGSGRSRIWAISHLWLHAELDAWFWRVEVVNRGDRELPCDAVFIQDLGLGERNFLMGNEAYASQYLDHFVAQHRTLGPVFMSRQNLSQSGGNPWTAHGCVEGAAGFATDYLELWGPPTATPIDSRSPSARASLGRPVI